MTTMPQAAPRHRVFFGWKVVAAAFWVAAYGWGFGFYGPTVFLFALNAAHGWSLGTISSAITVHYMVSAVLIARLSEIHRRLGLVRTTRLAVLALALGAVAWAIADRPWQLFAAIPLTAIGWAGMSGAAINAIVAPWFDRRRAAALGYAYNGASFGGLALAPLWMLFIDRFGLIEATLAMAAPSFILLWWLAGRFLGSKPADLGLEPDGAAVDPAIAPTASAPSRVPLLPGQLLRLTHFRTMSLCFAFGLFAQVGIAAHIVTLLAPRVGEAGAAFSLSLVTFCGIAGRLALGELIGDTDRRLVTAGILSLQAVGVFLLALSDGWPLIVAGCVLFGLGFGNLVTMPPLVAQAEFEAADVPRVVALLTAINQGFFAFAPGAFGLLHDLSGAYTWPLFLAVSVQLAGAAVIFLGRRSVPCGRRSSRCAP